MKENCIFQTGTEEEHDISDIMSNFKPPFGGQNGESHLGFTGENISKDLIEHSANLNQSLYSGGSSLVDLNYAFGPVASSKP